MANKRKRSGDRGSVGSLKWVLILLLVLLVSAVLLVGAIWLDRRMNEQAISSDTYSADGASTSYKKGSLILDDHIYDYYHNYENYLFIGTDNSGNEDGEGDDYQNAMADYLMLLTIDKTAKTFTITELNRDSMVEVDVLYKDGTYADTLDMQLCTAHWYGPTREVGCENQVKAVSNMLGGLLINGYISISMNDIPQLNNILGGVYVTLLDDFTHRDPEMVKGATLKLTDEQAYHYLQGRIDVGGGTNEERMARQHQYMNAFLEQGLEKLASSPSYFYDAFERLQEIAVSSCTVRQYSKIAKAFTGNDFLGFTELEGEAEIGDSLGDGVDHAEFYLDEDALLDTLTEIYGLEDSGKDVLYLDEEEDDEDDEDDLDEEDIDDEVDDEDDEADEIEEADEERLSLEESTEDMTEEET